ncbi:ABC [Ectocarpus sp. CCAP 1310/34]|nr:ABC [Ectocarpus sp. CCAP 1310/34]
MRHATVATAALVVSCCLLACSSSVAVAWTTTQSSRRLFEASPSLQCRQSSARPLARLRSSRSSDSGYGVRGGGAATSYPSFGCRGRQVQRLPWLRQSSSRLCSTTTGTESENTASPTGDKSGGVHGVGEDAGMGKSEPRQGADLNTQIGLFVEMSTPFFKASCREENGARWLLATVVALTLLNSGVSVAFSYIGRDFWTALSNKDPAQFNIMLQRFLLALIAGVPVTVFYRFERQKLALSWREWMTKRVMEIYYSGQTYYALEASKEIDNPDQRIAEDVRAFTQVSLEFLITVLTSCIDLASFSTILYSIYPQLFIAIIGYASVGTFVTTKLGGKLVGLNFDQLQTEADFRYSLIRVRENAESIAFYGGVQQELNEVQRRFGKALDNFGQVIRAQRNLEFFTTGYRYLIQVLPGFVVAPLFFQGKIELGVVSQSYGAFNHILGDLSLIVNQFESLSAFSAGIDRLGEFLERMSGMETIANITDNKRGLLAAPASTSSSPSSSPPSVPGHTALDSPLRDNLLGDDQPEQEDGLNEGEGVGVLTTETAKGARLTVEDVSVVTPTGGRVLMSGLSFSLGDSERLLIVGESGAGKSSLLRAIAGLWTTGSGKIVRPTKEEMFFLPQRPYCTLGPLRDQITYPSSHGGAEAAGEDGDAGAVEGTAEKGSIADDDELLDLLEKVDLGRLAVMMGSGDAHAGLGAVRDWSDMLSLGEQQRLAFARLLYNKPTLAILDESTSALDLANEERMFALLDTLPGLSVVSVGHRPSLVPFHDTKLILASKGFKLESTGSNRKRGHGTGAPASANVAVADGADSSTSGMR